MKQQHNQAPDTLVTLADGRQQHLHAFWKECRLVLVFLRHLG